MVALSVYIRSVQTETVLMFFFSWKNVHKLACGTKTHLTPDMYPVPYCTKRAHTRAQNKPDVEAKQWALFFGFGTTFWGGRH